MKRLRSSRAALLIASLAAALVAASVLVAQRRHVAHAIGDARRRQLVQDQDRRSAARLRADRVDRRPRASTTRSSPTRAATSRIRFRCSSVVEGEPRTRRRSPSSCKRNVHFADGTPLTSADVVFSFRRLINLKGNPSFLLAGVTVSARGQVHGRHPLEDAGNRRCRSILANPSPGIVNSKLVKTHGGTDAANAAKADKAEKWLNSSASAGAGSGPYMLKRYSTTSQITLDAERAVLGREEAGSSRRRRPQHDRADAADQHRRGSHEIAIDLSSDQAQTMKGNKNAERLAPALDLGLLRLTQQRLEGLGGHVEQAVPEGGPLRARLRARS